MVKSFEFTADESLFEIAPEAKIGGLYVTNLRPLSQPKTSIDSLIQNLFEDKLWRFKQPDDIFLRPEINKWLQFFETGLGINTKEYLPSHVALLKRTLKDKQLIHINTLVDLYNIISLRFLIPIGGHDVSNIDKIVVGRTRGGEVFKAINSSEETTVPANEYAYLDGTGRVLTRNLVWRQSDFSKVTDSTTTVFIPIDDITSQRSYNELASIANECLSLLKVFFEFEYGFGVVNKFNPTVVLSSTKNQNSINQSSFVLARTRVDSDPEKVKKFFDRKLDLIYPAKEEFEKALLSGQRLKFYIGADATAPRLHLGHLIPVMKMAELQQLGHKIIFLVGDFTAQIGDPTDKSATRIMLTKEEVHNNATHFKEQISKYIDFNHPTNPAEVVFNSEWNGPLSFADIISLASHFTVQQMLERDMFQVRLQDNKPIFLHEFLYPLMQGFDSVALEVDGEFGGRDQTFNMLAGRSLLEAMKKINKFVITTHFLLSADGKNKMSKSIGNCIFITDSPQDKYGKVMAIPDDLIPHYYKLATNVSDDEIKAIEADLSGGKDAMEIKKQLALLIVKQHDGIAAADSAATFFEKTIQNKEAPIDIATYSRKQLADNGASLPIKDLLLKTGLVPSSAEAKRLVQSGAVYFDGKQKDDPFETVDISTLTEIRVGKRKWLKLID